ncbi:serine/threonine-protein phosphatase 4 regulatory subunit 2 [Phlebotomus papatasi]|uniref:serine/threonine-protein phosphatase 4 regulatory subunit 2 n=1 Tax=Phlebotomus papatasi TaxID=29031 RepID=UPI00248402B5|nr:serine/threonine-protein phosphatase 4 regulatory subunit 2 [Phlebotomus papatasi]
MLVMENPEEVLQILERYTKIRPNDIPQELELYIRHVAKTGDTVYRWPNIKYLFREKLICVIKQFHDSTPSIEDLPQYPNVDPFNYETMKNSLLERLDTFSAAPFTIQRIAELLSDPRKQYTRIDKFMRAVEKNILVVSTIEPGRKATDSENGDSLDSMVNGDLPTEVDVDIDMSNTALPPINTLAPSAAVIMAEVAAVAKFVSNASKSPTPEDNVTLPDALEVAEVEPEVNITDSIEKFDGAEEAKTDENPPEASAFSPVVVIKPLDETETPKKEAAEESVETKEEEKPAQPETETAEAEVPSAEVVSEEPEKIDSDNSNVTISSSSSDDSNSTDESLTGQSSDAEEKAIAVSSVAAPEPPSVDDDSTTQDRTVEEIPVSDSSSEGEAKSSATEEVAAEEPAKAEEVLPEEEKLPETSESTTTADNDPPIAFHATESKEEPQEETQDRTEDGEPVCKKPMEMLIEVPPALPLEDIPAAAAASPIDVVSQMVEEVTPSEELVKIDEPLPSTDSSSSPSDESTDLVLPLEVAEMEVAPVVPEVSAMATEDTPIKNDDAMEVDESSMEPMDQ